MRELMTSNGWKTTKRGQLEVCLVSYSRSVFVDGPKERREPEKIELKKKKKRKERRGSDSSRELATIFFI